MFGYKSTKEQLIEERIKNEQLNAKLAQAQADLEYIAKMTGIELKNKTEEEYKEE